MNTKEILEKLKMTFSELVNGSEYPETAPEMVAPIKAKLKDGTEVEVTELGVGGVVTIAGQPAPAGEHTLEDGTVIVVGENGVISELKPVTPVVEDMGKDMKEKFSAFETATNEKFSAYEAKFADYEVRLAKATKVIEGLLSLTQTLAEQPTGTPDPVVTGKNNFSQTEKKDKNYSILFS